MSDLQTRYVVRPANLVERNQGWKWVVWRAFRDNAKRLQSYDIYADRPNREEARKLAKKLNGAVKISADYGQEPPPAKKEMPPNGGRPRKAQKVDVLKVAERAARKVFNLRGNPEEVHFTENELSVFFAAVYEMGRKAR